MKLHIEIAKHISKDLDLDYKEYLSDLNYLRIFERLFLLGMSNRVINTLVCAIIYSYSNSSKWIDLRQDGFSINKGILEGLKADFKLEIYQQFLMLSNEDILDCIGALLDTMKSDWKFITIRKMIDFHSKTMMQSEPDLTNTDEEKKPKVRENISRTMKEAVLQRDSADKLIAEIETTYVGTNHRIKQDLGVEFTEQEINISILSWRDFIKYTVLPLKNATK
jgi:hypothetical protein